MSGLIYLKPGREKAILNRHPWIFSGAINVISAAPANGDVVSVYDAQGDFIARGTFSEESQIAVRILTWDENEAINDAFWRGRLKAAIARRATVAADTRTTAYRLVNAESDGLPGLIVDRYGDYLVVQALSAGIELHKADIVLQLEDIVQAAGIVERSDTDARMKEGLPPSIGMLSGELPPTFIEVLEHGLRFRVDVHTGQKTGFYLDQRDNRKLILDYAPGAEVLNAFSYTGAFGVYAASVGAMKIVNVDTSVEALKLARRNMQLNGYGDWPAEYVTADVFEQLRAYRDRDASFDLIVLDPPKFAQSKDHVDAACRGYKDINLLALKLLRPGGILFTFSCSGLVSADLFQKVVFQASIDAGRQAQILHWLHQPPDHPMLLSFPEGAYLKGFVCQVW